MESLRDAYAAGNVDPQVISLDELREQSARDLGAVLEESRRPGARYPVGPVEQEIKWMQGFQPREGQRKLGRDELCPCTHAKVFVRYWDMLLRSWFVPIPLCPTNGGLP